VSDCTAIAWADAFDQRRFVVEHRKTVDAVLEQAPDKLREATAEIA
jgi:hypothetical protein